MSPALPSARGRRIVPDPASPRPLAPRGNALEDALACEGESQCERQPSRATCLGAAREVVTRWTRGSRCRMDVEIVTAEAHPDQGRCPRCRRNL
jgi:hypothetical protein